VKLLSVILINDISCPVET